MVEDGSLEALELIDPPVAVIFVTLEGRLNRDKISDLVSRTKYGLHMRDYEGFGIAIAELAYAGCLVFAPG